MNTKQRATVATYGVLLGSFILSVCVFANVNEAAYTPALLHLIFVIGVAIVYTGLVIWRPVWQLCCAPSQPYESVATPDDTALEI